ncbi:MAG: siderophore-interacting protein [Gammaproteobacteria bacterium]|nr:siderophore-interacting protein [Gammaproteobacteria bacterium]
MKSDPKKTTRKLQVIAVKEVSPHYRRITLGGNQLSGFPADETGGYIKLLFKDSSLQSPLLRTYTIRNTRIEQLEIDVDFVLHEDGGPASLWAERVEIGATLEIGGPGPKKLVDPRADWFLFAGDMTAIPAICVNLEQLPENAQGHVLLEIPSELDIQSIVKPSGVALEWIVNPHPGQNSALLVNAVKAIPWRAGLPGIWTACEFKAMKQLRRYYMKDRGIDRKKFYISSYWKHGISEDQHKLVKKADAEQAITAQAQAL